MPSGLDELKAQLKLKDPLEAVALAGALTSSEGKLKSMARAVRDIAIWRLVPIATQLGGAFLGVRAAIKSVVRDSGTLESAWQRLAKLQFYKGQLEPLLKSAGAAKERLAELIQLSGRSKFDVGNLGQWVAASRSLEILTRGG